MEKLVLLDDEIFVSEVLVKSLEKTKVQTFAKGKLKERLKERDLDLISEEEAIEKLSLSNCQVYTNSEQFLPFVLQHSHNSDLKKSIRLFKDKALFRDFVSRIYPDFFFKKFNPNKQRKLNLPITKELILKPSIGFFALGVKKFYHQDFEKAINDSLISISKEGKSFSKDVLDDSCFIIEEVIEGEEFACDAYFDREGKPVIVGLYQHPFKDKHDSRQLLYITSKKILIEISKHANEFLLILKEKLKLKNFPIHFEFRIRDNILIPIEVNPLRFGGFGLADLTYHAFGINPYFAFLNSVQPEWNRILDESLDSTHAWVLGRMEGIKKPNVEKFKQAFQTITHFVDLDYRKLPVFCIAYTENEDINEVLKYLYFDFGEYNLSNY